MVTWLQYLIFRPSLMQQITSLSETSWEKVVLDQCTRYSLGYHVSLFIRYFTTYSLLSTKISKNITRVYW